MMLMSAFPVLFIGLCAVMPGILGQVSSDRKLNTVRTVQSDMNSSSKVHEKDVISRQKRSDDVDLAALQAVVQQQAATIQQLQSQQTATQNEMTTLKNSLPTTFLPVAFSVRFSNDPMDMSTHSILQFDHVITNQGNGYSPQTGMFTAPYAGVYCFFINLMSVNGHGGTYVAIDKHGTMLNYAFADGSDVYDQGTTEVTVHLAAGEQVWARQHSGNAIRGGLFTVFTGYLLQAD